MFWMTPDEIKHHQEMESAARQSWYLELMGYVDSLSIDQGNTLVKMLHFAQADVKFGPHVIGLISAQQRYKHDHCECNGTEHKKSDHDSPDFMLAEPKVETTFSGNKISEPPSHSTMLPVFYSFIDDFPDEAEKLNRWLIRHDFPPLGDVKWNEEQMMTVFKLRHHTSPEGQSRVVCILCGGEFVSLADRMLRLPDECPGCFEKSARG